MALQTHSGAVTIGGVITALVKPMQSMNNYALIGIITHLYTRQHRAIFANRLRKTK
tara:strand:- start:498 stop:665 length:168 start_codon:yes stop_codon:yes gene_type:complete